MEERGDFNWALNQVAIGHRVRCTQWSEWGRYLYATWLRNERYPEGNRYIFIQNIDGESLQWHCRPEDRTAEWVRVRRVPGRLVNSGNVVYFQIGED
jgi:hypothetical protein